jgi:hypothetical protein
MNFWTAGRKFPNSTTPYGWCMGPDNITAFDRGSINWGYGRPHPLDNGEECLHFYLDRARHFNIITDRNCSMKFPFACEVLNALDNGLF